MKERILTALRQIEETQQVRILLAVESGSRWRNPTCRIGQN